MPLLPIHEVHLSRLCRSRRYGDALNFLHSIANDYTGRATSDVAFYYTSLGRVQSYRGDYDQADIYFSRAEKINYNAPDIKLARTESYIQRGKLNDAEYLLKDLFENYTASFPTRSKAWVQLYTFMMRCMKLRGDYQAAALCFNVISPFLDERDVAFRDMIFINRMMDSNHPDSIIAGTGSYSKHLRKRDASGVYLQGNALACIFLRNRLAETVEPNQRATIHSFLARIYMNKGQLDQAHVHIGTARAITEDNPYINSYLIEWRLKKGFNQQARALYDEHAGRLQHMPEIAISLARNFLLAGEYDLSIELAKAVKRQKCVREKTLESADIILDTSRTRMRNLSHPRPAEY